MAPHVAGVTWARQTLSLPHLLDRTCPLRTSGDGGLQIEPRLSEFAGHGKRLVPGNRLPGQNIGGDTTGLFEADVQYDKIRSLRSNVHTSPSIPESVRGLYEVVFHAIGLLFQQIGHIKGRTGKGLRVFYNRIAETLQFSFVELEHDPGCRLLKNFHDHSLV